MIEFEWKPDKTAKTPIYRQIVKYISDKIAAGDWVIGSRLPSQRAMALAFDVNRSTIVTAMEELLSYGILESDFGGGTRVKSNSWSLLMSQPPDWNKYISSGPFHANLPTIQITNKLEFEPGYIRIGTGELAPELYPNKLVTKIFRRMPEVVPHLVIWTPRAYQNWGGPCLSAFNWNRVLKPIRPILWSLLVRCKGCS